ncbi:MAG: Spy/CpxP family protein refolding chaperone [Betaproteobacteria bacterium]
MTRKLRRFGLGLGAAILALGVGAGVYASQNQNTDPSGRPFMGRHMRGPMGPMGFLGPMRRIGRQLGITDAQRDQIKSIVQSHGDELKALRDRELGAHQTLRTAITADTLDDNAIRQASAGVAAVDADLAVARAHIRSEIWQVLTPDQQAKAKQLQAQFAERMKGRGPRR